MKLLKERHCNFTTNNLCKIPPTSIFDRSQTPCGTCDVAEHVAQNASEGSIFRRNSDQVDGRTNWEIVLVKPDKFTVETTAFAPPDHHGPIITRIQGGKVVR